MDTNEGARQILAHTEAVYAARHEYVPVREEDFRHLDLRFYRDTRAALAALGFRYLDDWEDRTIATAPGNFLMPVMIRVMASEDGAIQAGIYHARVKPIWLRLLLIAMGRFPRPTLDLETEFPDGSFVCTSTAGSAADAIRLPPTILTEHQPRKRSVADILARHRQRVAERQAVLGVAPLRAQNIEDVRASQSRMDAIKAAFRTRVGGITKEELRTLSLPGAAAIGDRVHDEIVRLQQSRTAPTTPSSLPEA